MSLTDYPNTLEEAEGLREFLGLAPKDPFERAVEDALTKIERVNSARGSLFDTLDEEFWANPKKFPSTVALREIRKWVDAAETQYDDEEEPDGWSYFIVGRLDEEEIQEKQWVDYDDAFTAAAAALEAAN